MTMTTMPMLIITSLIMTSISGLSPLLAKEIVKLTTDKLAVMTFP